MGERAGGVVVVVGRVEVVGVVVVVVELVVVDVSTAPDPLQAVRIRPKATTEAVSRRIRVMLSTEISYVTLIPPVTFKWGSAVSGWSTDKANSIPSLSARRT